MNDTPNKMHPLMIVAATSVTIASLVAIASFAGFLPSKTAPVAELTAASTPQTAVPEPVVAPVAQAPVESVTPPKEKKVIKEKPVSKPLAQPPAEHKTSSYPPVNSPTTNPLLATSVAPPMCRECGTIESVHEVKVQAEGSGLGAIAGGLIGGLLGNQMGRGNGKTVATVAAAAGGAYAGHQVEKNARSEKETEITVRFDDGSIRTYPRQEASRWRQGDRIRLNNGALQPL